MSTLVKANQPCESCGSSDALAVYDTNTYCFSCGNIQFRNKRTFESVTKIPFEGELPEDYSRLLPKGARAWLKSCNIDRRKWESIKLGYSLAAKALVIPMFEKNKLVGYQLRYYQPNALKKAVNVGRICPILIGQDKKTCVIVEDIRSALKVSYYTDTVALMGCNVKRKYLYNLCDKYDHIVLWLDGDTAGQKSAQKYLTKLRMCTKVNNIRTDKDPKWYSRDEIKELIFSLEK